MIISKFITSKPKTKNNNKRKPTNGHKKIVSKNYNRMETRMVKVFKSAGKFIEKC
jgi:hypothetical protein